MKLIAPTVKQLANPPENVNTDSDPENLLPTVTVTSTPVESKTTTTTRITPVNSRNNSNHAHKR